MIRICRLGVIAGMTATAAIWRGVVVAVMAPCTIVGNNCMTARKGVIIAVNREGRRLPSGICGMAG